MTNGTDFVAIAGGITGREHLRARRDGQDGFAVVNAPDVCAAVVTDGCSSGKVSEVGARLGAIWIAQRIGVVFPREPDPDRAAARVTADLIEHLRAAVPRTGEAIDPSIVAEMFLFGFLAAVVTPENAVVFGVGDGVVWIDGRTITIDPGPDNAPPYPAYALLGRPIAPAILHRGSTSTTETIAIATDGAVEVAGDPLDALVREPKLGQNPSLLRKRLLVLSDRGLLWDDTTLAIVRRRS
jgi:hypothetical protein